MGTQLHRCPLIVAATLVAAFVALPAYADAISVVVQRVDVSQFPNVSVYVSVADSSGAPVNSLDTRAFVLQEDGKPIDQFAVDASALDQDPIATALVVDVSASMAEKLASAKAGAMGYVDTLGPSDRGTVVSFGSRVTVVQDYTSDKDALRSAVDSLAAGGNRVLYDAVAQTARRQGPQPEHRKPIILLTDGADGTSSEAIDSAVQAATAAGSPVYIIGLGSAVNRDALIKITSASGGRAVFVGDPGDLKPTYLAINDQLRRAYVLRYSSKLSPDAAAHGLAVQVTAAGTAGTGLKSFAIPAPASVTIGGLNASTPVRGVQRVTVDVTGGAQAVQLLVDDQVRGTARGAPTTFDWDATNDKPGPHSVVVRVTDMQGISSDTPFTITVAAPVQPTLAPTPRPTPTPATSPFVRVDPTLLVGVVLLLILLGAAVWYLTRGITRAPAGRASAAPPVKAPDETLARGDMTEVVSGVAAAQETMVRGRERIPPQVHLAIVQDGQPTEFVSRESPITLGRAEGQVNVLIHDPLVSSEHARIRREGSQFFLEDLASKNGTAVNGEPIAPGRPRALKNNDHIYIGNAVVTFVVDPR